MTFPVVLGSGKRLLGEGSHAGTLRLIEHEATPGGAAIATYAPAGAVETGSFAAPEPSAAELERRRKMAEGRW